jgi:hypothetical protein
MSEVKVNKVSPRSGTTVTIGDSGDTINIVGTLQNNGSSLAGDISSVVAGTGLSGGATSGVATLNIEAAQPTITSLGTITSFRSTGIDDNANAIAITIDSSENVGIGTTSPDHSLHIVRNASNSQLKLQRTGNSTATYNISASSDGLAFSDQVASSERMRINSTGVGIGTSSPASLFHIESTSADPTIRITNKTVAAINTGPDIEFWNNPFTGSTSNAYESGAIRVRKTNGTNNNHDNYMSFETRKNSPEGINEHMRITSAGHVGIGTTSPNLSSVGKALTINDTSSVILELAKNGSRVANFFSDGTDASLANNTNNALKFLTNNTERMRISSAGKVLVNTTGEYAGTGAEMTVNDGIDVGTTSTANGGFVSFVGDGVGKIGEVGSKVSGYSTMPNIEFHADNVSGGSQAGHIEFNTKFSSGSRSEAVRITSGGFVGIGTTSPGSPLTVSHTNSTVAFLNNNVSATTDLQNLLLLQSNCSGSAGVGFGINIPFNGERNDGSTQRFGDFGFSANTNSGTSLKTDCIIKLMGGHEVLRLKQTNAGSQNEMIAPDLLTSGTTSNRYPLYWVHSGTVGSIQPYTGSVREMKTDINDMSSVNWIHSLRPRSFKFRDFETSEDGSKVYLDTTNNEPNTEYGLIAEEVNEVNGSDYILDKQIDEDGNENLKGVLYHNLVPVLLKAVQEQKNTIQELEARITTLENA